MAALTFSSPLLAVDWQKVTESDATLWHDHDSENWGKEGDEGDLIYFDVYSGAWAGAEHMSKNAIKLSYDCDDGRAYAWNKVTRKWDFSQSFTDHGALSDLALEICWDW